jgi:uncharacterized protein (DUF983 family)
MIIGVSEHGSLREGVAQPGFLAFEVKLTNYQAMRRVCRALSQTSFAVESKNPLTSKPAKSERPPISDALWRCLRLRCPACGNSSILQRVFRIAERCKYCGVSFKREEGFFVGALLINIVTTEAVILLTYALTLPFLNFASNYALGALLLLALVFPLAFYHHSWSVWLTVDHLVETLPKT